MSDSTLGTLLCPNLPPTPDGVPRVSAPGDPVFGPPAPDGSLGRLAHYRVQKRLGVGGMGAVYLALDEGLDRKVALKVMLPEAAADPAAKERFVREARAAAAVRHDNVVTIYQVGEDRGVPFIAMEFLSGTPLDAFLRRRGRLTVPQVLRVGQETAEGLAAAHALGLVHRDIKPANLWLEAPRGRIKILDFGIARRAAEDPRTSLTGTGIVIGTPGFMSPEQARGRQLDARSDLFSLGCVLYQLTTGRLPFEGDDQLAVLTALAVDDPHPVRSLNPDVPAELEAVIHRLLAKNRDARPASAAGVAVELRTLADGPAVPLAAPVPDVVYVPVAVAAHEPSVFAGITEEVADTEPQAVGSRRSKRQAKSAPRRYGVWGVVAGVVALVAALAVGAVYAVRKPDTAKDATPAPEPPPAKPAPAAKPLAKAAAPVPQPAPQPAPQPEPQPVPGGGEPVNKDFGEALTRLLAAQPLTEAEAKVLREAHGRLVIRVGLSPITDARFEMLAGYGWAADMPVFQIAAPNVTDIGFAHVARLRSAEMLSVSAARVTDDALKSVAGLQRLNHLGLNGTRITDKAAAHLAGLRTVTSLDLGNTAFGDDGLKGLAPMTWLATLNLQGNAGVTDAGLEHLHGRKLLLVNVRNTKVTPAGVRKLQAALPGCTVLADPETP